jgi:hypothetical protein
MKLIALCNRAQVRKLCWRKVRVLGNFQRFCMFYFQTSIYGFRAGGSHGIVYVLYSSGIQLPGQSAENEFCLYEI